MFRKYFKKRLWLRLTLVALCIASLSLTVFTSSLKAKSDDELASEYAPVLRFTSSEKFYPTSVDYIVSSSVLKQRNSDGTSTLVDATPKPDTLGTYTSSNLFLDNKLKTFEAIAADYSTKADSIGYYVYVNVVKGSSSTVIQYWLFYVFNNGPLNEHQGDIEVIQVFLDASGTPKTVLASQHGAGQNAAWSDVEKSGTHPVIYVAEGSHANYFRSYQGKMGIENDIVGSDGKTITPDQLRIVLLKNQSWLNYKGRWGYWGTDEEVALGRAGPLGPKYNQDGVRWSQPEVYLETTFHVDGVYFALSWIVANFMLLFGIYIAVRGAWKAWSIIKAHRKSGLLVGKFLKGRSSIGLLIVVASMIVTVIAFFMPWYSINAWSETGPLAQEGGVTLMSIDGVNGVTLNLFLGPGNADSTSGYVNLFSAKLPFAIILAAGAVMLVLDVIGIKSGKSLGRKLAISMIGTLLPVILIIVFVSQLQSLVPLAAGLLPGQSVPAQVENMIQVVSHNPAAGTVNSQLPIVGLTTVNWGLGMGAYLLIIAAVLKIVAGFIISTAPEPRSEPPPPPSKQ